MNPDLQLKIAALVAALTAITVEDIAAIRQTTSLGPNIADNIANLQQMTNDIDNETIDILNQARQSAGLPTI